MITEIALVTDFQNGIATVQCQSQSACGSCAAKKVCGSAALSELNGSDHKAHIFQIESITPLKIGQQVEIGLAEKSLLFSAILLYFIPLLALVFSTILGSQFFAQEWQNLIFVIFCTALSHLSAHLCTQKIQKSSTFKPILLKVLN